MARRASLHPNASKLIAEQVAANIQQALYHWPAGATSGHVPFADATQRFIAIPPVLAPSESNHLLLPGPPIAVEIYRAQDMYFAFNSQVSTLTGAILVGGLWKTIPLHPGLRGDTLAMVANVGTDRVYVNWIQG